MISRTFIGKFIVCLSLFTLTFQSVSAQKKPQPLTLDEILNKLSVTSRTDENLKQINAQIVKEINKRKVGFEPTADDERKIKARGGNRALIKAVKANFAETRSPAETDSKLALELWNCNSKTDLADRKQCLRIAKKLALDFKDEPLTERENKDLENYIQKTEELIKKTSAPKKAVKTSDAESFPNPALPPFVEQIALYAQFIACYPKTDLESRKLCVKIAREFFDKFKDDAEVKSQIDYFREYIPFAEKVIAKGEELDKSIREFNACLPKEDLESRKSCLALAKELLKKDEMAQNVGSLKRTIQELEKTIAEMSKNP
ncbi:MAG: hypothetical protein LUM44_10775 [Pyrinomonadaceae bacterium]|nr:hypothetical protein [Pyrinomonadaceae bacterium]